MDDLEIVGIGFEQGLKPRFVARLREPHTIFVKVDAQPQHGPLIYRSPIARNEGRCFAAG